MLVVDLQTAARELYNAVGDSFFTDVQVNNWATEACSILAEQADLIENIYSTTTIANQQDYPLPTYTISVKRVTLNGKKIKPINLREDDALTLSNQQSTQSGFPTYYSLFNRTISFRTIPDTAYTMKIYSFNYPVPITNSSTLEIPGQFHFKLVDYILMRMFTKDKDVSNVQLHKQFWDEHIKEAKQYKHKQKRADGFATVQDEETLPVTIMGAI